MPIPNPRDLPDSGIKLSPVSSALAGRFFIIVSAGKPMKRQDRLLMACDNRTRDFVVSGAGYRLMPGII